jgi:hypothetical protein
LYVAAVAIFFNGFSSKLSFKENMEQILD